MISSFSDIDVFILCGGRGKRLGEICSAVPKPMLKVARRPFLDFLLRYMAGFGFRRFILGLGYKADVVVNYFKASQEAGIEIVFSCEDVPLDTGGAVKEAKRFIQSDSFFVLNGDCVSEFNPLDFLRFHKEKRSQLSILLSKITDGRDYGEVSIDQDSRVLKFNEKPDSINACWVNSGAYIFNQEVFGFMPDSRRFSLEKDLFPAMAGKDIFGYKTSAFFIDIGTPQRYAEAASYFKSKSGKN